MEIGHGARSIGFHGDHEAANRVQQRERDGRAKKTAQQIANRDAFGGNQGAGPQLPVESRHRPQEGSMASSSTAASSSAGAGVDDGLTDDLGALMRALKALIDPYRPEQHYMRGPGPKWHAKHDPAESEIDHHRVPAL